MKNYIRKFIPEGVINFYHKLQAMLANVMYGFPGKKMTIIGITGTNGKSTVGYMISKILDESGNKNALVSTIYYKIDKKIWRNNSKMTTINPFALQKILKQAYDTGCRFAIVETTSHAIVQHRIWGIDYDTLIFTNLTHDHLDYHGSMKNYLAAKLKLFIDNQKARAILNADDKYIKDFKKASGSQIVTYSTQSKGMVNAKKIKNYDDATSFEISWFGNKLDAKIHLLGDFNVSNALASFCTALAYNISPRTAVNALESIKSIPGRMEMIECGQDYRIALDFAHTPDGLQQVFEAVRPVVKGRLIHVGGATGERDKTKRPILGALAGKYADIVIVTDEDPGEEKPEDIINQVAEGINRGTTKKRKIIGEDFFKIKDRKKAIKFALELAKRGDFVLITGKGHEQVMKIGDRLVPYSDKKVIREYFKNLK